MNKFIFLTLLFFMSATSQACQCKSVMIKPIDQKANYIFSVSNNVFLVKVTSADLVSQTEFDTTTNHNFDVLENYKGNPNQFTYLVSGGERPTSCDDNLEVNRYYIVFTNSSNVWNCSVLPVDLEDKYYKELTVKLNSLGKK